MDWGEAVDWGGGFISICYSQFVVDFLKSKADMLKDYFSLEITQVSHHPILPLNHPSVGTAGGTCLQPAHPPVLTHT